jgi:hypothetical protein
MPPASASRRRWIPLIVAAAVLVIAAVALAVGVAISREASQAAPQPTFTRESEPPATSAPTPTPTGPAADTNAYDLSALPVADVFTLIPALPVDDDPFGSPTGLLATPAAGSIPVFAEPGAAPVAALPVQLRWGGTTLPVVKREDNWVRVLVSGRQGTPPEGNPAQLTGWLRAGDVVLTEDDTHVEVSLSGRTISIVSSAGTELVASDFGSGVESTPTPVGRTFIMHTEVMPYGYTRGHPLVYLGVQSPTLAGFDGADTAVTAFHYHDAHSGVISNGCIRLDAAAIDRLAQLPAGTPVYIVG